MRRKGVKILGVDGFSIGPYGALSDRNHVMFCRSGGIIIEMLDLSTVEAGRYILFAMPLKIENFEAAPARVALARPEAIGSFLKD
jgi:kynurenine formamidase